MARQDQILTTASLDGVYLGEFQTFSGGDFTAPSVKATRGAGRGEIERGGRQTTGNVTIGREDDGAVSLNWLRTRRGKGRMVVHRTPLDDDGNPRMADQIVYTGKLLEVRPGDGDTLSDSQLDNFELEMGCDT